MKSDTYQFNNGSAQRTLSKSDPQLQYAYGLQFDKLKTG